MAFQSRAQWLRLAVLGTGVLALVVGTGVLGLAPATARLAAQTRKVSVEGVIYDLKHPDPVRRRDAARELGVARHVPATPHLVAMAHDPVAAVRREVEFALESMDDIQSLPGFVELASDTETDIRARAVACLVNLHLPRASPVGAALTKLADLIGGSDQDADIVVEPDVPVDPVVVATLRARLGDSERGIRRTAIRGLGSLRADDAIPDLLEVVREFIFY